MPIVIPYVLYTDKHCRFYEKNENFVTPHKPLAEILSHQTKIALSRRKGRIIFNREAISSQQPSQSPCRRCGSCWDQELP